MKKLTIGSLKYGSIKSTVSIEQPDFVERQTANEIYSTANETNKVVDIKQNQQSFQVKVKKDQSILDAALEQNFPLEYSCKKGTCGKCKVNVVNGDNYLHPANSREEKKLQYLIKSGFRLACQAIAR